MVVGLFQVLSLNIPDHKVKRGKEMISNLVLQDTINGIKNIGRCELTIVDLEGKVVASTEEENNINRSDIVSFAVPSLTPVIVPLETLTTDVLLLLQLTFLFVALLG